MEGIVLLPPSEKAGLLFSGRKMQKAKGKKQRNGREKLGGFLTLRLMTPRQAIEGTTAAMAQRRWDF